MLSTEMILFSHVEQRKTLRDFVPPTYVGDSRFEEFMAALGRRYRASAKSMASAAEWTAFPYEQAVADGLWLVFIRTAERLGLKLSTPDHVFDIAPRVNRVLNGAFSIIYKTMDEAAEAFDQRVAQSATRSIDASPASEAWAIQSATFFAELIKASQAMAVKLETLDRKRDRRDLLRVVASFGGGEIVIRCLKEFTDGSEGAAKVTSLKLEDSSQAYVSNVGSMMDAIHLDLRRIRGIRRLPLRIKDVPEEVFSTTAFIDQAWFGTQVLLALIQAPIERDYVIGKEFVVALSKLKQVRDLRTCITLFRARMKERDQTLGGEDLAPFDGHVLEAVSRMQTWDVKHIALEVKEEVLLAETKEIGFGGNLFRDLVAGTSDIEQTTIRQEETNIGSLVEELGLESFRRSIHRTDWSEASYPSLYAWLNTGIVKLDMVIDRLAQLREAVRLDILQTILEHPSLDKLGLAKLIKHGWVIPDGKLIVSHGELLTERQIAAGLPAFFDWIAAEEQARTYPAEHLVKTLRRLRAVHLRKAMFAPGLRRRSSDIMSDLDVIEQRASIDMLTKKTTGKLVNQIYSELGLKGRINFGLAREVIERETVYIHPVDPLLRPFLPPWDERDATTDEDADVPGYPDLALRLKVPRSKLKKILCDFPEDAVFLWLYEADPGLKKRFAAYVKARKAYYAK